MANLTLFLLVSCSKTPKSSQYQMTFSPRFNVRGSRSTRPGMKGSVLYPVLGLGFGTLSQVVSTKSSISF